MVALPLADLPREISILQSLALDLRWTWSHEGDALWSSINRELWEKTHNPWAVLQSVSAGQLRELARAAVSATTHDLATLRGYWTAEDLAVKTALGLFKTEEEARQARDQREKDKLRLIAALEREGLLPEEFSHAHAMDAAWSPGLGNAVQIYLVRSPALLLAVQLDDLACQQQ